MRKLLWTPVSGPCKKILNQTINFSAKKIKKCHFEQSAKLLPLFKKFVKLQIFVNDSKRYRYLNNA